MVHQFAISCCLGTRANDQAVSLTTLLLKLNWYLEIHYIGHRTALTDDTSYITEFFGLEYA